MHSCTCIGTRENPFVHISSHMRVNIYIYIYTHTHTGDAFKFITPGTQSKSTTCMHILQRAYALDIYSYYFHTHGSQGKKQPFVLAHWRRRHAGIVCHVHACVNAYIHDVKDEGMHVSYHISIHVHVSILNMKFPGWAEVLHDDMYA